MPNIDLSILNQRQTPAFFASSLATRPAFGFAGRIFIDSDVPSTGLYRDTGAAWVQIADPGAGTTGTLQQVTTNGNTTSQGITITAGGLSSNIVTIAENGLGSAANYITGRMAGNDTWKIYGTGSVTDQGEMVFEVGDNGQPISTNGQKFRFSYDNSGGGTGAKDVFIVDYNLSYFNTSLGVNTDTPTAAFDVHSGVSVIAQLNQTVATNNSLLAFQNNNAGLWRIGNFYNAGANDFGVFDVIGNIEPFRIKKTTGQVLIGTSTVGSGKLVVASSTGDNGVQIVGASAPSLRIDNAESGPTKRAGLGISTATNNFIQGSADRDFCMFNGSTTASPILFGIYDTTNVQEAARISAARNFLIGQTADNGSKLQVNGSISASNMAIIAANGIAFSASNNSATFETIQITNNGSGNLAVFKNSASKGTTIGNTGITMDGTLSLKNVTDGADVLSIKTSNNVTQFNLFSTTVYSYLGTATAIPLYFASNGNINATLSSAGNLLIGTTTDAGQKLQVSGESYITGNTGIGAASLGDILQITRNGAANYCAMRVLNSSSTADFYVGIAGSGVANVPLRNNAYLMNSSASNLCLGTSDLVRFTVKSTGVINITSIPTSATGLSSGDIYSNLGVLTIVP